METSEFVGNVQRRSFDTVFVDGYGTRIRGVNRHLLRFKRPQLRRVIWYPIYIYTTLFDQNCTRDRISKLHTPYLRESLPPPSPTFSYISRVADVGSWKAARSVNIWVGAWTLELVRALRSFARFVSLPAIGISLRWVPARPEASRGPRTYPTPTHRGHYNERLPALRYLKLVALLSIIISRVVFNSIRLSRLTLRRFFFLRSTSKSPNIRDWQKSLSESLRASWRQQELDAIIEKSKEFTVVSTQPLFISNVLL